MFIELIDKIRSRLPSKINSKLRPLWFFIQRLERGFDDSELWSLDATLCKFLLPRLKRFKKVTCVHPACLSQEEWNSILDEIIWLCEQYENNRFYARLDDNEEVRANKAKDLLGEYLFCLWW